MFVTLDTQVPVRVVGVLQLPALLLLMGLNTTIWVLLGITLCSGLETHQFLDAVHALADATGVLITS
jgi:hypothetical protein